MEEDHGQSDHTFRRKNELFYLFFQPIKVVNDDSDEEVQREERTNDNKDNKIQIRSKTVIAFRLFVDLGEKRKKKKESLTKL